MDAVIRAAVTYFFIMLVFRIAGKRSLAERHHQVGALHLVDQVGRHADAGAPLHRLGQNRANAMLPEKRSRTEGCRTRQASRR